MRRRALAWLQVLVGFGYFYTWYSTCLPLLPPYRAGAARARNSLATLCVAEPNFYYWGVVPYVCTGMDSRRSAPRLAHVSAPRDPRMDCWISRRYFRRFFICLCSVVFRGRPEIQAGVAIVVSGNRIAQFQK